MGPLDEKGQRKLAIISIVVILLILAVVGISVFFINRNKNDSVGEIEKESGLIIENPGFASDSMDGNLFGIVSDYMEVVVTNDDEKATAPEANNPGNGRADNVFVGKINNAEFSEGVYFPYSTYSFSFTVSDGRKYDVNTIANLPGYYGVLIRRAIPEQEIPKLYIGFLGSESQFNYKRSAVITAIMNWAKNLSSKGFYLTTVNTF